MFFLNILFMSVLLFCMFLLFCAFALFCLLFLLLYIAVSFLFVLYMFTDHCDRVENLLQ